MELPRHIEDLTDADRAELWGMIQRAHAWPVLGAFVVGSYAYGRPSDDPPGDLDLVIVVEPAIIDVAEKGVLQYRWIHKASGELARAFDVRVETFYTNPQLLTEDRFVSVEGTTVPHYDVETGEMIGKEPGAYFKGGFVGWDRGRMKWRESKWQGQTPPRERVRWADMMKRRVTGQPSDRNASRSKRKVRSS